MADQVFSPSGTSAPFWRSLQSLVDLSEIIVSATKGSPNRRFRDHIQPLDYGHLNGTHSDAGDGIRAWIGSNEGPRTMTGVILTVDLLQRESLVNVCVSCTDEEMATVLKALNHFAGGKSALLFTKPEGS